MKQRPKKRINWDLISLRIIALCFIGIAVILPIIAITSRAFQEGFHQLISDIMKPEAYYSLRLTFILAFIMIGINTVMGTLTAWVLVRYSFPGKSIFNALIDLPFAVPTVVTGLMLVVLYGPTGAVGKFLNSHGIEVIYAKPGIVIALLFVTLPFVVRSVQPVLMALDSDMEEVAETLGASRAIVFWRVIFPSIVPAMLTGSAQAFSRALGEFGSVAIVAGNIPMVTQVAPVYIYGEIESYNPRGALAVSVVLLAGSLIVLLILNFLKQWGRKHE